jgi:hypothetical protein
MAVFVSPELFLCKSELFCKANFIIFCVLVDKICAKVLNLIYFYTFVYFSEVSVKVRNKSVVAMSWTSKHNIYSLFFFL